MCSAVAAASLGLSYMVLVFSTTAESEYMWPAVMFMIMTGLTLMVMRSRACQMIGLITMKQVSICLQL